MRFHERMPIWGSAVAGTVVLLAACGGSSGAAGSIVIGATLPLTGALAPFGAQLKGAYELAVQDVNAQGGLSVGGSKHHVKLVELDDQSNPNLVSQQTRDLAQRYGAVAEFGPATPPLVIPAFNAADQVRVPDIAQCPLHACLSGQPNGWKYGWFLTFDETQQAPLEYQAANLISSNKRVALFTDTEEDGITMGNLWINEAPEYGYTIAYHASFPVGTTDFSNQIAQAKAANAEILIAQMLPPDGQTLWKQMKALGFHPKYAACEKCANSFAWRQGLGPIAEGTEAISWWTPQMGYPGSQRFYDHFVSMTGGLTSDLAIMSSVYTQAMIMLDAISAAGSTDASAVNAALARTNKTYLAGPVKFNNRHASIFKVYMTQWQGANMVPIYPTNIAGAGRIESPVPGLA
ncbi:MAG TPA: amino acid ABC transporter substrate-binding protein [Candidatus Dormibacteraeota bacterium]|nr:amino acid ABC transporter substrate-binding protein [Candidatus Dormibacteraeota bacterium]